MIRPLAASFASLAMAVIVIRGAVESSYAGDVILNALVASVAFAMGGALVGWIMDYIIRENLRNDYTNRVQWYRDGIATLRSADDSDPAGTPRF